MERLREAAAGTKSDTPGSLASWISDGRELHAAHLDLIDDAFKQLEAGTADRVLITMPPRHGKTRRAARWGPIWWLRKHPGDRVILASYSGDLADEHGRFVRDTISNNPRLGLTLHPGSWAANRFDLLPIDRTMPDGTIEHYEGGGMSTTGVGGTITGRGADLLIVDDPIKGRQEADNPLTRQRLWDWWQNDAITRLEPGGRVVVIQTRWHEDDLAGRLLLTEPDEWLHIDLPAIAYDRPDGKLDALGRKVGEALWPARFALEALLAIKKRIGERAWGSLYQQQPRPLEGGVWEWSWITDQRVYGSGVPALDRIVVAVDPAGGGTGDGSDETGIVAAGISPAKHSFVLADKSGKMSADAWGRTACLLALELRADAFVVEQNFGGDMTTSVLKNAWNQLKSEGKTGGLLMPAVKEVYAKQGKRLRAEPIAQVYEQGRVHHVGEFPFLETQMTSWLPSMDSPDRMDAAVHALTELHEMADVPATRQQAQDERLRGRR